MALENLILNFRLAERGVGIHSSFDAMLAAHGAETRLVTVATPIRSHEEMHAACVRQGFACYLEKPPTLDPVELERMIVRDAGAAFQTQVGFSYLVEEWRHILKARLWSGEFGRLIRLGALGFWQRPAAYYTRSPWAGRLTMADGLVLDSCFGNAMAHHIHNLLFFAGEPSSWARIEQVRAELYRANAIESMDTVVTEAVTTTGIPLRAGLTHACPSFRTTAEHIITEKAEIVINPGESAEIRHHSGTIEHISCPPIPISENIRSYTEYLVGRRARPVTTLADSRPIVAWNALLYVAAGQIHSIPLTHCSVGVHPATQSPVITINGIEAVLRRFVDTGIFPSDDRIPWAASGGSAAAKDLDQLRPTLAAMSEMETAILHDPDGDLVPA